MDCPINNDLLAIKNSIEFDPAVARWFAMLISIKEFHDNVCELDKTLVGDYKKKKFLATMHFLSYSCALLSLGYALFYKKYLFLGLSFLALILFLKTRLDHKKIVTNISMTYLKSHYPKLELSKLSLYALSERLARKYDTGSLVDVLAVGDRCLILITAISIILTQFIFIHVLNAFWGIFIIYMTYLISLIIINFPFIYKRLGKVKSTR